MSTVEKPRTFWETTRSFLEMIRFSHTLFALPFAIAGSVLAWRSLPTVNWQTICLDLSGILVCMVLARTTAMAFNRIVDRKYDAANPRTAARHIPSGKLSLKVVTLFTLICAVGFILSTLHFWVWNQNLWPLYLSLPTLFLVCGYSYAKRFTSLSHILLGAALAFAPVAAWLAITGSITVTPLLLGLAVLLWVAGFDILYATQDTEFDQKAGLHSIPAALGNKNALRLAMVLHLLMIVVLFTLRWQAGLGLVYLMGVVAAALLLLYEHSLVKPNDLTRVNQAFFQVNAIISIGLLCVIIVDVWVG